MCVNFIPMVADILRVFGGAKWFANIDMFSGFHQIRVRVEDQPKTAKDHGNHLRRLPGGFRDNIP